MAMTTVPDDEYDDPESWNSDDPDYRALWDMTVGDLTAIENDPRHPLHEKAKIVGQEMMSPIVKVIEASTAPTQAAIAQGLGKWATTALAPLMEAQKKLDETYSPGIMRIGQSMADAFAGVSIPDVSPATIKGPIGRMERAETVVDLKSDEPPEATAAETRGALSEQAVDKLRAMLAVSNQQLELTNQQLEHMRRRADLDDTRAAEQVRRDRLLDARHLDTTRLSRKGVAGGWTAAILTAVAIIVSLWPKGS